MLRKVFLWLVASLAAGSGVLLVSSVSASGPSALTCSGGPIAAGRYLSINVTGVCFMPGGTVTVLGPVTVGPNAVLAANFPAPGPTGSEGDATVIVHGSISVGKGATMLLGCSPFVGCVHTTSDQVNGGIEATNALGVIVHSTTVLNGVSFEGGGGGVSCVPTGFFTNIGAPDYSDLEDNTIRGPVTVSGLDSCWFGMLRNSVHGPVNVSDNTMADPDAMEVHDNTIWGDLNCEGNHPAVQFGDAKHPSPNLVHGEVSGQCVAPISVRVF